MGTTTTFSYDRSRRLTAQYSSAEAHYYSYNQRNMVTQIQDVKSVSPDANRYFAYNAVGERVYGIDGTTTPSYWAYDGRKMLSESVAGTTVRYAHNDTIFDFMGSMVEHVTADLTAAYAAFNKVGSVMRLQKSGSATSDTYETNRWGGVLGSSTFGGTPTSSRFQNMSSSFMTLIAAAQQMNMMGHGGLFLTSQALDVASGLFFNVSDNSPAPWEGPPYCKWKEVPAGSGRFMLVRDDNETIPCGESLGGPPPESGSDYYEDHFVPPPPEPWQPKCPPPSLAKGFKPFSSCAGTPCTNYKDPFAWGFDLTRAMMILFAGTYGQNDQGYEVKDFPSDVVERVLTKDWEKKATAMAEEELNEFDDCPFNCKCVSRPFPIDKQKPFPLIKKFQIYVPTGTTATGSLGSGPVFLFVSFKVWWTGVTGTCVAN